MAASWERTSDGLMIERMHLVFWRAPWPRTPLFSME
jgi:hypothetical protein